MSNKILSVGKAIKISKQLKTKGEKIVLAGGCFDILHLGHINFIKKAKEQGDVLILLLESDQSIREKKGEERPINNQQVRAQILAAIIYVDYVVLLPKLENKDYDAIISSISPAIIATTEGDLQRTHKERQGKIIGAVVVDVISTITDTSATKIANILSKEL